MSDPSAPFDRSLVPAGLLALDLEAVVAEHGTPLFVYDEDFLRARCRAYVDAFGEQTVVYASKAFLCLAMARVVADEGLLLDVATGGELHVALRADFPPERIVFHGNNKSEAEILAARNAGVGRLVADSFDELDRLDRLHYRGRVLVRVAPGVEAHTHEYIETGTERSKFGFPMSDGQASAAVRRVADSDTLELGGLHCHIGSQVFRLDSYSKAGAVVAELAARCERELGLAVPELDLGGGLGARYLADDPELDLNAYATVLRDAVGDRRVLVEPGRSIAASAAITVYRVGTVKRVPGGRTYVAVDGGMSDNPRPVLYGAGYEAYLPARIDAPRSLVASIAGKHCEQGDVIVADARLPADVAVGELLVTPVTGAYGASMASNYNKVPRPAAVFVRDGTVRTVVERESLDDLVRLDRF